MWKRCNPNPCGKTVGDCAVRAVALALDLTWENAYEALCAEGRAQCDMPSSNAVWGAVLRQAGFTRYVISNNCPDCYSAEDFAHDHAQGVFVLAFGGHVAAVVDGVILDSWDSSKEIPAYFYFRRR